jgi:hypothetical protein
VQDRSSLEVDLRTDQGRFCGTASAGDARITARFAKPPVQVKQNYPIGEEAEPWERSLGNRN